MRSIENLELNRNLLHSAEMQINKTCNSRFKKLLKRIYVLQFSTIGAIRWGGAYLSEVEVDYTLLICIAVAVLTEIQSSEFASFLNLKRIRRQHKTAIKTRRNTLRNAARDLSNHNGVVMSPSEATIEIRSARARVSQIESTLVRDIIGLGDNHMGSPEWSGVGSFIYVVVLIGFLAGYLITGSATFLGSGYGGRIVSSA
ncbi:hypothetical protein ACP275_02G087700 [Erythranthe tilingii]